MCLELMDTDLKDPFICEVYDRKRKTFEKGNKENPPAI